MNGLIYPLNKVKPENTATELKCVVVKPVLLYLEDKVGISRMMQIIASTEMNIDYLKNGNNWVSFNYYCKLLATLIEATGDPKAPFNAGRMHSNRQTYSTIESFMTRLMTPGSTYRFIGQFYTLWTRVNTWDVTLVGDGHCIIKISYPKYKPDRNNCLAIQGSLAAVPPFFGLPGAEVVHKECTCDGADTCVYEITWIDKPKPRRAHFGSLVCSLIGVVISSVFLSWSSAGYFIISACALAGYFMGRTADYISSLSSVYASNEEQARSLLEAMVSLEDLNLNLQNKVEKRTVELSTSNAALQQALKDLKRSQKRAMQIERQAAIGALAAGTAHEMNSPLNGIRLSIQALKEDVTDDTELLQIIDNADRASLRCSRIVKELLSFSRSPQQLARFSLKDIVNDSIRIFCDETPSGARVESDIPEVLPSLHLDRAQIQQALLNLFSNANDAMNGEGTIHVTLVQEGQELCLKIADTGPGMSKETMDRIFDPFYSTKASGNKGLGLGLSITHELITKNGGTIQVDSEWGKGTCFTIMFPLRTHKTLKPRTGEKKGNPENERRQ